ncbi:MAG: ATP-binding cassette domain-containing protein [Actinobacteria bacterium]|uniref:Unannotated protein n=1 Tax=freshwater metagenome TaxID=449393 RepID=A0A6J6EMU5_9ZZZZ|nr:ATP-binding cassette domain-containing protein [Actinomycetota bacterium]
MTTASVAPRRDSSIDTITHGRRLQVAVIALASLVAGATEALFLVLITRTAFSITEGTGRVEVIGEASVSTGSAILLSLLLVAVRLALGILVAWCSARLTSNVTAALRREMAESWLMSSWEVQNDARSGQLQELLSTFTQRGSNLVSALLSAVTSGFNLLALIVLAAVVDPFAALVVTAAVAVLAQLLLPVRSAVRRNAKRASDSSINYATTLSEISQLGLEMHVFSIKRQIKAKVDSVIDEQAVVNERLDYLRQLVPTVYAGLAYLAVVLALGAVTLADSTDLRSVGAVMLVILRSLTYGQGLQAALTSYSSMVPYVNEIVERVTYYQHNRERTGQRAVSEIQRITVRNLSFEYRPGVKVLDNVSFDVAKGEVIGIIGPSGSGKSTLVQLLLGLRRPSEGDILIDGKSISDVDRELWSRLVTFVPQKPRLISGTIEDNIRFFREDVSREDVERAARLANLEPEIIAVAEGYHREVGTEGNRLSGGQQQRLCIARALVERPDVLILDEPTSSLDAISEVAIRETLDRLRTAATVIIVAHRLSTLTICDRILVLQEGQLVAFDTPENLDTTSAFFAEALRASASDRPQL